MREGWRPRRDEPQAGERSERRPMRDAAGPREGAGFGGGPARPERGPRPERADRPERGGMPMSEFDDDTREPKAPAQDVGQLESLDSVLGDAPRGDRGDRGDRGGRRRRRD